MFHLTFTEEWGAIAAVAVLFGWLIWLGRKCVPCCECGAPVRFEGDKCRDCLAEQANREKGEPNEREKG